VVKRLTPVALPPGRLRLATKPILTGSPPTVNTIGIVDVAALAASAEGSPPVVARTATPRRTRSAASAGRRSYWPSALECAPGAGQDHAAVLTLCRAW